MRIQLCGNLVVEVDGRDAAAGLPGRRGRLVLAYLVANRERPVRRDELIEAVWPGEMPGAPESSLSSLLTGVRRALGREALTGRSVLTLTLPPDAWIDVEAARESARAAETALAGGNAAEALDHARAALDLTAHPVLAEFQGDWVDHLRADVGQLRCDQLETAARAALALGELVTAERTARTLIELEPYRESGYALLMEALARGGNVAEALRTFDHVRVLLRDELGVSPAAGLTAQHERLLLRGEPDQREEVVAVQPGPELPELPLPGLVARSERRSFVAREREMVRLRERWSAVRRGQGELVLLTGEPGIGKTRLAARFAAEAHAGGAAVIYGRADEETVVPYQPFVEALRHLVAHIDAGELEAVLGSGLAELRPLLPELLRASARAGGEPPPENGRHALFEAASALLDHVAQRRPLIVLVEDLHWADKPTLLLLRQVVRRAEAAPMMVLGTYRDVELGAGAPLSRLLADLRREQVLHRISLTGLDDHGTAALVAERSDAELDASEAVRLREYTAGNPFFIEETVRSIGEARLPEPSGRAGGIMRVPESVQDIILRRCERLRRETQDVLTAAAVLGRDFPLSPLERFADRSAEDVLEALEESVDAGLVLEDPERVGRFSFCHALVRETIYARPAASRRQRLHLRAGEALAAGETHAAELAHHFYLGRHAGGASRAVEYGIEAGRAAARALAYEEAAGHFERALAALDLVPGGDDGVRTELLLELGAVRWQGGEAGARGAFDRAAELARRRGDHDALVRAALGAGGRFYAPGRADPAYVALLEEALEAVGGARVRVASRSSSAAGDDRRDDESRSSAVGAGADAAPAGNGRVGGDEQRSSAAAADWRGGGDERLQARVLARLAEALPGEAAERRCQLSSEAVRLARSAGDDAALAAALLSRHAALLHVRHHDERVPVAEEAVALADRLELLEVAALARHWLIYDLMEAGDLEAAGRRRTELQSLAQELGQPLYRHSALAWRGVWAQLGGRFDEAERLAREGLRLAERAGARDANAHFTAQLLAVRREQGRLSELLPAIERLAAEGSQVLAWRGLLPIAYLESGEEDKAAAALGEGLNAIPQGLFWLPATAWLAEAAWRLGDSGVSAALLGMLEPYAGRLVQAGFTGSWGAVDRYLGLAAAACGRADEAAQHLDAALERHLALDAAPLAERTRRDRAAL